MLKFVFCGLLMVLLWRTSRACPHPSGGNKCFFREFPCKNDFSYGCKNHYCWAQCVAILFGHAEWCYTVKRSDGNYLTCKRNEDCVDGTNCALAKCSGQGCTVASRKNVFREIIGLSVEESDFY